MNLFVRKKFLRVKRSSLQRIDVPLPVVVVDPAKEVAEGRGLQLGLVLQLHVLALTNRVGRDNQLGTVGVGGGGGVGGKVRIPEGDFGRSLRRHRVDVQRGLTVGSDGADSTKNEASFYNSN